MATWFRIDAPSTQNIVRAARNFKNSGNRIEWRKNGEVWVLFGGGHENGIRSGKFQRDFGIELTPVVEGIEELPEKTFTFGNEHYKCNVCGNTDSITLDDFNKHLDTHRAEMAERNRKTLEAAAAVQVVKRKAGRRPGSVQVPWTAEEDARLIKRVPEVRSFVGLVPEFPGRARSALQKRYENFIKAGKALKVSMRHDIRTSSHVRNEPVRHVQPPARQELVTIPQSGHQVMKKQSIIEILDRMESVAIEFAEFAGDLKKRLKDIKSVLDT